jgi:hypothetical protein
MADCTRSQKLSESCHRRFQRPVWGDSSNWCSRPLPAVRRTGKFAVGTAALLPNQTDELRAQFGHSERPRSVLTTHRRTDFAKVPNRGSLERNQAYPRGNAPSRSHPNQGQELIHAPCVVEADPEFRTSQSWKNPA